MRKYVGCQCMICQKNFQDNDEIVVCPECGTPYHKACYQSVGHCINTPLHESGTSWQSVQNEQRMKFGGVECPHCGFVNLPGSKICSSCDLPLEKEEPDETEMAEEVKRYFFQASDPCCGIPPEYDMEGERLEDVANFVRTNTLYYIPLFKRFQETQRKISFNLPCILFPYFYFANRKMWLMAILSGIIWLLCSVPGTMLNMLEMIKDTAYVELLLNNGMITQHMIDKMTEFLTANQSVFENLETPLFLVGLLSRVLFCLFGNYLYFRFVLKSVKKIRSFAPSEAVKKNLLVVEGGTNVWNILGISALGMGAMLLFSFVLKLLIY